MAKYENLDDVVRDIEIQSRSAHERSIQYRTAKCFGDPKVTEYHLEELDRDAERISRAVRVYRQMRAEAKKGAENA